MILNVKVDNFEGPFDLLLHLIKKNEMDIYNIKIYDITNQYLQYLEEMKEMDLEVTSEFILIAATLLEIKSKMLLPSLAENKEDAEDEADPRKDLVIKLVEYKKFKQIAAYLKKFEETAGVVFAKKPEIIEDKDSSNDNVDIFKDLTMVKLYNIYNDLINRYNSKINRENVIQRKIPVDAYKIEDKMIFLRERIVLGEHLVFSNLMQECSSKMEVVVTFLALLELIKLKNVKVLQDNSFAEIYLERIDNNEEDIY